MCGVLVFAFFVHLVWGHPWSGICVIVGILLVILNSFNPRREQNNRYSGGFPPAYQEFWDDR